MLHQHCTTSVGLGWPQSSNRLGLHRYRGEGIFGTQCGRFLAAPSVNLTCIAVSTGSSWSAALGEAYGEGTECYWSQSRNWKIASVCLCACLYIDALFCRSTTHCCAPKISLFCPAVVCLPTSDLQSTSRGNQKKPSNMFPAHCRKKQKRKSRQYQTRR